MGISLVLVILTWWKNRIIITHPHGDMNVWVKFHGHPSNSCWHVLLKRNKNLKPPGGTGGMFPLKTVNVCTKFKPSDNCWDISVWTQVVDNLWSRTSWMAKKLNNLVCPSESCLKLTEAQAAKVQDHSWASRFGFTSYSNLTLNVLLWIPLSEQRLNTQCEAP